MKTSASEKREVPAGILDLRRNTSGTQDSAGKLAMKEEAGRAGGKICEETADRLLGELENGRSVR